jgi:hypothetical protein
MVAPSFSLPNGNDRAAIAASPGFEGRYAATPSKLTQQLVAKGLHKS